MRLQLMIRVIPIDNFTFNILYRQAYSRSGYLPLQSQPHLCSVLVLVGLVALWFAILVAHRIGMQHGAVKIDE